MPLTLEDRQAFEKLEEAAELYAQYLEISRIAQVPTSAPDELQVALPPTNAPLTLVLHPTQ